MIFGQKFGKFLEIFGPNLIGLLTFTPNICHSCPKNRQNHKMVTGRSMVICDHWSFLTPSDQSWSNKTQKFDDNVGLRLLIVTQNDLNF